jgi:magnesium-transporting ATPase (P-type)
MADFVYQAESPDEGALVDAARDLGYVTFYSYTNHSFIMLLIQSCGPFKLRSEILTRPLHLEAVITATSMSQQTC